MNAYSSLSAATWRTIAIVIGLYASALGGAAPSYALAIGPDIDSYTITITFNSGLGPTDTQVYNDPHADTDRVNLNYGNTLNGSGSAYSIADAGITLIANGGCLCLGFADGTGILQDAAGQTSGVSAASLTIGFDVVYGIGADQLGPAIYYFSGFSLGGNVASGSGDFVSFDDGFTVTDNGLPQDPTGLNDAECGGSNAFSDNTPGPFTVHPRCLLPVVSPHFYSPGHVVEIDGFLTFTADDIGSDPTNINLTQTGTLSPSTNIPEPSGMILVATNLMIFGGCVGWSRLRRKTGALK